MNRGRRKVVWPPRKRVVARPAWQAASADAAAVVLLLDPSRSLTPFPRTPRTRANARGTNRCQQNFVGVDTAQLLHLFHGGVRIGVRQIELRKHRDYHQASLIASTGFMHVAANSHAQADDRT